eukprot:CAMPEP_0196129624 /NCGR_PEP_ID=MMETSP0910-20130528/246_1 /TAXON_ID=49265 /ORGANISM="Thalassiosira rotula, Strain GSO102" /LENGTH=208 /DNA_ID=CAMNT_0041388757 /DNA_START=99 /DNA_END=725 /DNA_ORIENTATION=-
MSAPVMIARHELPDRDAAMSLCSMMGCCMAAQNQNMNKNCPDPISPSSFADLRRPNIVEDYQSQSSSDFGGSAVPLRQIPKGKLPLPKKIRLAKRASESKRDPAISFEEMKRLMRVYGPTKCLRNRTPKESGKYTKNASVKRKFYRWFPDFHKRFVLQSPGEWYKPKIGHAEEMAFRETLRKKDQMILTAKRNAKKQGTSKTEPTPQS